MSAMEGELEKQPAEAVVVTHVFTSELARYEQLTGAQVVVMNLDTGEAADLLVPDSVSVGADRVSYGVYGGVSGTDYKATLTATSDRELAPGVYSTYEVEHLIQVKER